MEDIIQDHDEEEHSHQVTLSHGDQRRLGQHIRGEYRTIWIEDGRALLFAILALVGAPFVTTILSSCGIEYPSFGQAALAWVIWVCFLAICWVGGSR
jgi:hypothetical protein